MWRFVLAVIAAAALALPAGSLRAAYTPPPVPQGAWSTFAPVITAGSGTFTTVSGTVRFQQTGKRVDFYLSVTVTTNGTAAVTVNATLPVAATSTGGIVPGRGSSGKMLQGSVSGGTISILNYDNTYPAADNSSIVVSGSYEAQ
jgi:hypothetical protein